jgi:hypothetical protein
LHNRLEQIPAQNIAGLQQYQQFQIEKKFIEHCAKRVAHGPGVAVFPLDYLNAAYAQCEFMKLVEYLSRLFFFCSFLFAFVNGYNLTFF